MKSHITNIALDMIHSNGLINLSRLELCERAGIADGSFPYHMGCTFTEFVSKLRPQVEDQTIHKVVKLRVDPALRKDHILDCAIVVAMDKGYNKVTRDEVAEAAGVSMGLITHYFETMNQLKRDIMRAAVKRGIPEIVAQGLVNKDRHALKASKELKTKAANIIANY
ncbi:MAG: TetR/AcrR family transcriptional regulator [Proteobacteria bacterium]|nr:TetR/AcrR family transcriptional regulator [Pseudomonadota bacterium]